MSEFDRLRDAMVRDQIEGRGIRDPLILAAFRAVPREQFVAADLAPRAYDDGPLPIAASQTISQPYIVALMIASAGVKPGDRVLEVGAGSGYAAAVIGRIAGQVVAVERHGALVSVARDRMERLGYSNVNIVEGDGTRGWAQQAPYDAILVAATGSCVPAALIEQLAVGRHLVMPLGSVGGTQELVRLTKGSDGQVTSENLGGVRFVPLVFGP